MKNNILLKIFQALLLLCLFLFILEFGTRALISVKVINHAIRRGENDVIGRWKWIERHKAGIQIYYSFDKYDPTKGWGVIPNISNLPCFGNKFVSSNSKGIRGKTEYQYAKDKRKLRILVLGDSFTLGDKV